jgi:hypothetical protein
MLMSIPGLFVVLLIVGLVTDELTLDDAILFVIAFLVCYIAIRLLHIDTFWILVPTVFLNSILILKVIGYNPRIWPGGSGPESH